MTSIGCIIILLLSIFNKSGNYLHIIARIWARSILFISNIKVVVKGNSNIDLTGPNIYLSNHQSNIDVIILLAHLPIQFRWLAKKELFTIPIFGSVLRNAGYISVDRSNPRSAYQSLKKAAKIIKSGVSVTIFPEGTRSNDGSIKPFLNGGFILAIDSGVPVVPLVISGTHNIMPKKTKVIKPGKVILEIKNSIDTCDYTRKTKEVLSKKVREIICDAFYQIQKEGL